MSASTIVTRFAPSPTGRLTAGNARTALFAWAFARRHGGRFVLRIEDTDRARSTVANARGIIADLRWLGLDWDEGPSMPADWRDALRDDGEALTEFGGHGPYCQSRRLDIYREHLQRLLQGGHAYKCFKTPEQLAAERRAAQDAGRQYRYDPAEALALTPADVAAREAAGEPFVVRFRMPDQGIVVPDVVRGDVAFAAAEYEDFVIRKADGFPTFHLAVTVDDALMGVTHVLRAQDHLPNTPRHWALQAALGLAHPTYAHLPLIFNPDGSKMSKRDKAKVARAAARDHLKPLDDDAEAAWFADLADEARAASGLVEAPGPVPGIDDLRAFVKKKNDEVEIAEVIARDLDVALPEVDVADFRSNGYLPEALVNYLALLGWSPGDDLERFGPDPLGLLRERFSLERVVRSNARFDREKLFRFNAEAIAGLPEQTFRSRLFEHDGARYAARFASRDDGDFARFARAYQPRARTLGEPARIGGFFLVSDDELRHDADAIERVLARNDGEGAGVIQALRQKLDALASWTAEAINGVLAELAAERNLGMKKVAQPLRVAVSGGTVSPPIDQTLLILGKASTLARIDRCVAAIA